MGLSIKRAETERKARAVAERLGVTERTIRRYRARASTPPAATTAPPTPKP